MKNCPYCGREYPDEAITCAIDGSTLPDSHLQQPDVRKNEIGTPPTALVRYLTFPDYQWSARDAWKCLGMISILGFAVLAGVLFALSVAFPTIRAWRSSGIGFFCVEALYYGIFILTVAYFARTETLAAFSEGFGLGRKPTHYVWSGVTMALIIRAFGHFMLIHGWGRGVWTRDLSAFTHTAGFERYFFLIPMVILAPICEELVNRGFLYRAFRASYPLAVCMALMVGWTALTHWTYYSHSFLAAFNLSVLTIVLCYLREKSDSLWDCILCHFVFNASLLFLNAS